MDSAAGEENDTALRVTFDPRLKLEFHGSRVTSDAGLLPFRDLDDALGLTELAGEVLADTRTGQNSRHTLIAQLRQSVFGRLAGYEDVNDADRRAHDPALRWIVGGRAVAQTAASTSQMGRFETAVMTQAKNLAALTDLSGQWIDRVHARRPVKGIVLDMDSSVSPTFGDQEGTAYNGHFGCTCYHPLFVFNQFGDLERCALRPGNVHSAEGWRNVLETVVARYRATMKRRYFRADAAFASPEVYEFLEAEDYGYVIRLPANTVLQRRIAHLLKRPVGRLQGFGARALPESAPEIGSQNFMRLPYDCIEPRRASAGRGVVVHHGAPGDRVRCRRPHRGPHGRGYPIRTGRHQGPGARRQGRLHRACLPVWSRGWRGSWGHAMPRHHSKGA